MVKEKKKYSITFIRGLLTDSRTVGLLLILCTIMSLAISNSKAGKAYVAGWEQRIAINLNPLHLPHTAIHIVNDLLMALFFLSAGLEIKKEVLSGQLASFKRSMLPIVAALGGMIVPAVIYLCCCGGTAYSSGWGIPIATDIAFSLGVLSLLGKRAPVSLRIFLTALAIIDDVGGIITIAIFYAGELHSIYLALAGAATATLITLNIMKVKRSLPYLLTGVLLWYFVYNSGIHATIAGVILALCIPIDNIKMLEHKLHIPVNFVILPLFALANTAITLPQDVGHIFAEPLYYGILLGLLLGKPVGILLFSAIAVKSGLAVPPQQVSIRQMAGIGFIAGIGFTVSIFIASLAIDEPAMLTVAKVAVISASVVAGVTGFIILRKAS